MIKNEGNHDLLHSGLANGYATPTSILRPYWENRAHLTLTGDLLLYEERLVNLRSMRLEILDHIHTSHHGITNSKATALTSVWWPGLSSQIENMAANCDTCARDRPETKEPLMSASFASRPWEKDSC